MVGCCSVLEAGRWPRQRAVTRQAPCRYSVSISDAGRFSVRVAMLGGDLAHEQALVSLQIKETVDAEGWCTKGC